MCAHLEISVDSNSINLGVDTFIYYTWIDFPSPQPALKSNTWASFSYRVLTVFWMWLHWVDVLVIWLWVLCTKTTVTMTTNEMDLSPNVSKWICTCKFIAIARAMKFPEQFAILYKFRDNRFIVISVRRMFMVGI